MLYVTWNYFYFKTLTQNHALSILVNNILIKNMMDYLRNVSEKEELRPRLMQNQLIKLLFNLLFPMPNGFSVVSCINVYLEN